MMARTQVTLETQTHRRALQRASELDVSLAEYVRRLVARDLAGPHTEVDVTCVFDLGRSSHADVAKDKDSMIAEAFQSAHRRSRCH